MKDPEWRGAPVGEDRQLAQTVTPVPLALAERRPADEDTDSQPLPLTGADEAPGSPGVDTQPPLPGVGSDGGAGSVPSDGGAGSVPTDGSDGSDGSDGGAGSVPSDGGAGSVPSDGSEGGVDDGGVDDGGVGDGSVGNAGGVSDEDFTVADPPPAALFPPSVPEPENEPPEGDAVALVDRCPLADVAEGIKAVLALVSVPWVLAGAAPMSITPATAAAPPAATARAAAAPRRPTCFLRRRCAVS